MALPTSGLEMWFDASQETHTEVVNALPIPDLSGNGRDGAIEGDPVPPPDITWQPNQTPTGLPTYRNAGPRGITSGNSMDVFGAAEAITLMSVHRPAAIAHGTLRYLWALTPQASAGNVQAVIGVNADNKPVSIGRHSTASTSVTATGEVALTGLEWVIQIALIDYQNGRIYLFVNGSLVATIAMATTGPKSDELMRLYWFGRANNTVAPYIGDIAEQAAWSRALTLQEIIEVNGELTTKHIGGTEQVAPAYFPQVTAGEGGKVLVTLLKNSVNAHTLVSGTPTVEVFDFARESVFGGPQDLTLEDGVYSYQHPTFVMTRGSLYYARVTATIDDVSQPLAERTFRA